MNRNLSQPVPKALLVLDGKSLLARVVEQAREVCARCLVVTGWGADEVAREAASLEGVTVVHNPGFSRGMVSSILAGARQVQSDLFFVAPADMPFLSGGLYRAVLAGARDRQEDVFFPLYRGKRGHPVLIRRSLLPGLEDAFAETLAGASSPRDRGEILLKTLLRGRPCRDVPVCTGDIGVDLDTPDELVRAQERFHP